MLDKESTYICECTDVSVDGKGIARVGNDVVFAGGMIPGERARIRITGKKGKISLGTVEEILSASSFRVRSECPYAGRCGGCSLSSMAYEEQLRYKLKHVNDCLEKIGKTDITADTIIESPKRMGYRNKLSVQVRRVGGELALCYSSNEGEGLKFSDGLKPFISYVLPLIIMVVYFKGYYDFFNVDGKRQLLVPWMCASVIFMLFVLVNAFRGSKKQAA